MPAERILRNSQIIILGLCIAAATIASSIILSKSFIKITKFSKEIITVTGSAQKQIQSDCIIWSGLFSRQGTDLAEAYKTLGEDLAAIKKYCIAKGISDGEIIISPIRISKIYRKNENGNDTNEIQWYRLSQSVQIKSVDVERVDRLSRQSTELINQGIEFESQPPEYYYTKLDELKVAMLAQATENAKLRAASMAQATGNKIGFMRSAKMGVFQITPVASTEVSDWGVNDTSSFLKKVTAVVTVSFAIE
ncbi:MAG TPA: SIMPL domain-containing protein [Candidatus Omnitrophota bacterium]|nr:SIMPL domain-containing protein [Candidatus Omnitrophota bacterium]HNX82466.1 SIMPL domain-containing protein [Candidatus Omnitrophota bacterium]HPT06967.1 SIMPL domain-containing protein [Candidatus Omnitrophota bacterium]